MNVVLAVNQGANCGDSIKPLQIKYVCCSCACRDQGKNVSDVNDKGMILSKYGGTDQIGWLVPAVPAEGRTFWGYSSVPQDRVDWWKKLPL